MPLLHDALDVLVIEDDADTRANLCDILELDGHRVATAGTLAAALARDDWPLFSVVLLDRQLPDGLAEEALERIKSLAPDAAMIVITGHADLQAVIEALRHGAVEYILKPVSPEVLRASVARIGKVKQAERRAFQAERLAAIGQMVAGLAHESRNALQRSQACLEMLAFEIEGNEAALDLVRRIQNAQDHLQKLFAEVQGYAGPIKLEWQRLNLRDVWREAWGVLAASRSGRQCELREPADELDLNIRGDPFRLVQVLRNLFENSLAACGDPVEIEIVAREAASNGQRVVELRVRDNGPGLTPEQGRRLFEPFFTTKTQGTGLGMPIAQRIVEAHGGRIEVGDSAAGAEIIITLPRG